MGWTGPGPNGGKFTSWYIKSGEKSAVRFADEIIVLSPGVQEYFRKTYGRETVFIPNGVVRAQKRKAYEIWKQWGLEADSYVLFLGRIVPEKGIHYLIDAWKSVRTDKKLVIAGGGSDTQAYMDQLKALAGDGVIFTGFQQGVRVPNLIPPQLITHKEKPLKILTLQGLQRFGFSEVLRRLPISVS